MDRQECDCCKEIVDLRARVQDLERRCDIKERRVDKLMDWKNTVAGYAAALAFLVSLVATGLVDKIVK